MNEGLEPICRNCGHPQKAHGRALGDVPNGQCQHDSRLEDPCACRRFVAGGSRRVCTAGGQLHLFDADDPERCDLCCTPFTDEERARAVYVIENFYPSHRIYNIWRAHEPVPESPTPADASSVELVSALPRPLSTLRPREDDDLGLHFVYCPRCAGVVRSPLHVYRTDNPGRERLEQFTADEGKPFRKHTVDDCLRHLRRVVDELVRRAPHEDDPSGSVATATGHITHMTDELGLPEVE